MQFSTPLSPRQKTKLTRLIAEARNVPFYAQRFEALGIDAGTFDVDSDFGRIMPLSKAELLAACHSDLINRRFSEMELVQETTTGSTGQPFTQYMEKPYVRKRNFRFLRGLTQAGYRPWHKIMLVTESRESNRRYFGRWAYCSINKRAEDMAADYRRNRPQVLYGCTTPLRLLAEHFEASKEQLSHPHVVVTTAEMLDRKTRKLLERVFQTPVRDFYGLTEMGLVAWQGSGDDHYILDRNSVLTELQPLDGLGARYRLLMTNLDLHAAPLIRYDAGDVALARHEKIVGFEGRELDILTGCNGTRISPYEITTELQVIEGLRRFRLTQTDAGTFNLSIEADAENYDALATSTRQILERLLGDRIQLEIRFTERLVPGGRRKFRPVESLVSAQQP